MGFITDMMKNDTIEEKKFINDKEMTTERV